ncbi:TPA: hypothetical protein L9121_000096 [Klebsiella pneumoniae]|uniref:hypothetical protein n=1 Tax=Klebsiella pneumoniae TaxID=573 RepID=UPI0009BB4147|nr:hypothetical protein [Klebsiella pneumoniae]MDX4484672.1 hypothetical protein [Klebsiella pneumoniae]MDX4490126.1 hypothetical protein [Klebsiella pneumoniae]MDX4500838.1 hypothetical protein [Klebsiella pneumoniae]SLX61452.1 Uncharacterised protein [Klebsiella pneumoniae]SLX82626.1 Uncharacterised protein [Klebsiella pneumoniae]
MPTLREWKERRPASDIKQTVEFYHPAFGYYRVVNNLFRPATFGGNAFEPARFSVTEPAQDGTAVISMTITFVAATEHVRQTLKSWRGAARMTPIKCLYQQWNAIGDASSMKDWTLYVNDISADASNVTVTAGKTNPLTLANTIIYTTKDYPGLITV